MRGAIGGWVLDVLCTGCGASDVFRHVLLPLAGADARKAGWEVPSESSALIRPAADRGDLCPKCVTVLRE